MTAKKKATAPAKKKSFSSREVLYRTSEVPGLAISGEAHYYARQIRFDDNGNLIGHDDQDDSIMFICTRAEIPELITYLNSVK